MDFSSWSTSDYAAWWGAVIATLALTWNIVVALRSGPRIRVRATSNMQIYPRQPLTGDKSYISLTAVNHGNAPTTITHFCGYYSTSLWKLIKGKKQNFIVNTGHELGQTVPFKLAPGEEWSSLADQSDMEEKCGKGGYLYMGIIHNQRKRPVYVRVKLRA